ncbi:MAG: histidine kinase [Solirubrobacteraceae bacterium]
MHRLELRPLPLGLFAVATTLAAASVPLSIGVEPAYDTVLYGLMALAFAIAGLLIASRRPENAIGWLLCDMAVLSALVEFAEGYGLHETFVAAEPAQWFASWSWVLAGGQYALVFLLFPTGRLASARWRPVAWLAIVGVLLTVIGSGFGHAADSVFTSGANPYAVDGIGAELIYAVGQLLFVAALLAAFASLVVRFRRSRDDERQQLKWVAYPACALAVVGPLAAVGYYDSLSIQIAIATVVTAMPIAFCVAILRYRLYDIDVVISRTLVYASLTILLAGAYGLTTLVLGTALGRDSAWATAGATLTAAAAFGPLRRRVQDHVDRRFSRARHDALRRIATFLDELRAGLAAPEEVERVLREVLADPDLELRFCVPDGEEYVDAGGRVVTGDADDLRQRTPVERAGVRLGVVVHGAAESRPGLALELVGAVGLAIEITRLRVELRRRLAEVEASRARIVSAGYEERRRIERDIHDGAQQRLVSIGLALRHAQHELGGSPATGTIEGAVQEIGIAIKELRGLARGVRPTDLDHGLAPALRELAGRTPLRVDVRVSRERYPSDVEAAAYFIVCEAITNAVKHASAEHVALSAERENGRLVICVRDDGVGGADVAAGSGLRGLSDRVAAHGGLLRLESVGGRGTTLTAELPCAS